jgi:HKD family nuclease
MAHISIVKPTDQPEGKNRLLNELVINLQDKRFNNFSFIVAFAKLSPLLKLHSKIIEWKKTNSINAIFGVDQKGTSIEALKYGMEYFNEIFILHVNGKYSPTFHPKIYLFKGSSFAIAYVGSNNLTVGGTETNFESYTKIEMFLPKDKKLLKEVENSWETCKDCSLILDEALLTNLESRDIIISEKEMRKRNKRVDTKEETTEKGEIDSIAVISFPKIKIKPASPLPKDIIVKGLSEIISVKKKKEEKETKPRREDIPVSTIVIQIIPHHNGEILLSKIAVDQNATFFGWPFTSNTVPKKPSNPSYPQREPDPIVDIYLYNEAGEEILSYLKYSLNTVYYSKKSEIRITVPPEIYRKTSDYIDETYPIMVIKNDDILEGLDYLIEIYLPGSDQYIAFESSCNQTMPSGGRSTARKFGWL